VRSPTDPFHPPNVVIHEGRRARDRGGQLFGEDRSSRQTGGDGARTMTGIAGGERDAGFLDGQSSISKVRRTGWFPTMTASGSSTDLTVTSNKTGMSAGVQRAHHQDLRLRLAACRGPTGPDHLEGPHQLGRRNRSTTDRRHHTQTHHMTTATALHDDIDAGGRRVRSQPLPRHGDGHDRQTIGSVDQDRRPSGQRQTLAASRRSPPGRGLGFCGEPGQTGWVSFRPRT